MKNRRREGVIPPQDDHGFGIFFIERPEDARYARAYLSNPTNAALVVLAKGVRKKDLVCPRIPRRKFVRIIRIDELESLMASGAMLPTHWKKERT